MTPSRIRASVIVERVSWIQDMIAGIRMLPLADLEDFTKDPRNIAAAESYLRRGIEALLDLGRHILAKGFGVAGIEYKEICARLAQEGILTDEQQLLLRQIAGYSNRMVHFYHEITSQELYNLCIHHIEDMETLLNALIEWTRKNPELTDKQI